jgi:phosphatidylserine/phosphatidylglycerophosphate/cardiolipin synthase-like enzyme
MRTRVRRAGVRLVAVSLLASFVANSVAPLARASVPTSPVVRVWTEPAAGYGFFDAAVDAATNSIDLSVYELSDPVVERDLIARARAGVDVRVLLNSDYEGRSENAAAFAALRSGSVDVAWAPSNQIFHAKYLVVDGRTAYIGTGNLVPYDYGSTRDFWVADDDPVDVAAIRATFNSDYEHQVHSVEGPDGLVWSPGSGPALERVIASAHSTLLVENEEMDVGSIEQALEAAAARRVDVEVVMTQDSEWTSVLRELARAGVHVRTLNSSQVYIHAKIICADCGRRGGTLFVGSENFSTSSLDYNRELGVVTQSPAVVAAVAETVRSDFASGSVLAP